MGINVSRVPSVLDVGPPTRELAEKIKAMESRFEAQFKVLLMGDAYDVVPRIRQPDGRVITSKMKDQHH